MGFFVKLIAWLGVIGSAIGCYAFWPDRYGYGSEMVAILTLVGGLISSFLVYAFGHAIERLDELHQRSLSKGDPTEPKPTNYPEGEPGW